MPIPFLLIFAAAAIAGTTIAVFWEEIEKWFIGIIGTILDSINKAVEVTSDAFGYLVKEGSKYYQRMEIYVEDVRTGNTVVKTQQKQIAEADMPDDVKRQLDAKKKLLAGQYNT